MKGAIRVITTEHNKKPDEALYVENFIKALNAMVPSDIAVGVIDFNVILQSFKDKSPESYKILCDRQSEARKQDKVFAFQRPENKASFENQKYEAALAELVRFVEKREEIKDLCGVAGPGDHYNTVKYSLNTNPHRILLEEALDILMTRKGIPTYGVCGTHQQLSFIHGADIIGGLVGHNGGNGSGDKEIHNVFLLPNTEMRSRLSATKQGITAVNSIHTQAIEVTAKTLANLRSAKLLISAVAVEIGVDDKDLINTTLQAVIYGTGKTDANSITIDDLLKSVKQLNKDNNANIRLIAEAVEQESGRPVYLTQWHTEYFKGKVVNEQTMKHFFSAAETYATKRELLHLPNRSLKVLRNVEKASANLVTPKMGNEPSVNYSWAEKYQRHLKSMSTEKLDDLTKSLHEFEQHFGIRKGGEKLESYSKKIVERLAEFGSNQSEEYIKAYSSALQAFKERPLSYQKQSAQGCGMEDLKVRREAYTTVSPGRHM